YCDRLGDDATATSFDSSVGHSSEAENDTDVGVCIGRIHLSHVRPPPGVHLPIGGVAGYHLEFPITSHLELCGDKHCDSLLMRSDTERSYPEVLPDSARLYPFPPDTCLGPVRVYARLIEEERSRVTHFCSPSAIPARSSE
ncbi:hypothetical protein KC317_g23298, partial [Hortaea werneckii]